MTERREGLATSSFPESAKRGRFLCHCRKADPGVPSVVSAQCADGVREERRFDDLAIRAVG